MDCSLLALLACFSWSNLYVDGGLIYQDTSAEHIEWETHVNRLPGVIETVTTQHMTDKPFNPYGRLALGYELQLSNSLSLSVEASHISSFEIDDRGINAVSIKARWHPFAK